MQVQQQLIENLNLSRHRIMKNRLFLVSAVNLLTFLIFIFSMSYFQWVKINLQIITAHSDTDRQFWANLLYIKLSQFSTYSNFEDAKMYICLNKDIICSSFFINISFVGYLSFSIIMIGVLLQLYDLIRVFYYSIHSKSGPQKKDNFRHIITIATYFLGISLYIFSLWFIPHIQYKYGISFWLCVGAIFSFMVVIVYEQMSMRTMIKQALILEMIEGEKKIHANEIKKQLQLSDESEYQI